ncbi:hypothetical protein ABVA41_02895 [Streptococcus dysgalactiae subsp. equisimilis]
MDKVPLREFVYNVIKKLSHFCIVLVIDERRELKLDTLRRSKNARNMAFLAFEDFEERRLSLQFEQDLLIEGLASLMS